VEQERAQNAKLASDNAALATRVDDRDEQLKGLKTELKEARGDTKALQAELVKIARDSNLEK
jgi:septal ring factor EnvC (AmiA/AmiB activator)